MHEEEGEQEKGRGRRKARNKTREDKDTAGDCNRRTGMPFK